MSTRVLNPAMMSDMGHRSGIGDGGVTTAMRVPPTRAALKRVRRDLFGPVDHVEARALAERELRAQSLIDAERWGFDFNLGKPHPNSRFEWKEVTKSDIVPEPYALRGMPYISKHAPSIRKIDNIDDTGSVKSWTRKRVAFATGATVVSTPVTISTINNLNAGHRKIETTPPQESRLPRINDNNTNVDDDRYDEDIYTRKNLAIEPESQTTPTVKSSVNTRKQQSSITDFMKSRKRTLNQTTKSITELPEKIARTTNRQISS